MTEREKLADAKGWAEGQRKGAPNFHAVTLLDALTKSEAERDRLREALKECEAEIDNYIDLEKPRGVHPKWDSENTHLKELNPARLALQEDRDE